ncbi:hypothetical protein HYALB_00005110 [Hymenoscyphus albidus]|uniref:Uncharacterized protein n=1 Tax=Hymenoscyphus albidus TaxID=595503 RepID=A0A9N9LYB5_9HELO|nr:hypothetical protein HYALB_00005110 [Hymenoscyphus albidus]
MQITMRDWDCPLSIDFSFLDSLAKPEDFAESNTGSVAKIFRQISLEDILNPESERLRTLGRGWSTLCDNVAACVVADSSLLPRVMRLAEACCLSQ